MDLVIPDKNKTLAQGVVEPWTKPRYRVFQQEMKQRARQLGVPLNVPYHQLTTDQKRWFLDGVGRRARRAEAGFAEKSDS